jgi:Fe-S-cluster containining protein
VPGLKNRRKPDALREDALLAELRALYRDVDALRAGWSCASSTECCRFAVTGREPYVTSIEVLALENAVARRGGPLSAARRALPIAFETAAEERVCRFLDRSGRCSVYESRPFGCRTFYCRRRVEAGPPPSREAERELLGRLKDLAVRHEPGGDAARPLSRVFR